MCSVYIKIGSAVLEKISENGTFSVIYYFLPRLDLPLFAQFYK